MANANPAKKKKTTKASKPSQSTKSATSPRKETAVATGKTLNISVEHREKKVREIKGPRPVTASSAAVTPKGATEPGNGLKARFAALASATGKISGLKGSLNKNFFEVGVILNQIRDERLYEVKGYGSFEAFVEREIGINKLTCLRSARIAEAMHRNVALEAGLDRASAAVAALDGETSDGQVSIRGAGGSSLPIVPLHKQ